MSDPESIVPTAERTSSGARSTLHFGSMSRFKHYRPLAALDHRATVIDAKHLGVAALAFSHCSCYQLGRFGSAHRRNSWS
jgi:hypothetical protein